MDPKVRETQIWLNQTYSGIAGWQQVNETGVTGWNVIYGLRQALQSELSISPVATAFGPATREAYTSQIGVLRAGSVVSQNTLWIVSGALFCKGYDGSYKTKAETIYFQDDLASGITIAREELGLQDVNVDPNYPHAEIDVKLMASLLSMDAYRIPWSSGGTAKTREAQQWLNRKYSARRDFALIPCDGIFSRQVQTALLFALQYEIGMADGTANGNFGSGTKSGLQTLATITPGMQDAAKNFVRLYQTALVFNGYDAPLNGHMDAETQELTREFQSFMSLPVNGKGDYATWCNLLVSSGDPDASTTGFDLSRQLTTSSAAGARAAGYTHVGRYLTGMTKDSNGQPVQKFLSIDEIQALGAADLKFFPIMQVHNYAEDMTFDEGRTQAMRAAARVRAHGLPHGATIYFSVDFDPTADLIRGPVVEFFRGIHEVTDNLNGAVTVGVYGSRNVCSIIAEKGLAESSFVAGASTGWSGNMGFPMPENWSYNQTAVDKKVTLGERH